MDYIVNIRIIISRFHFSKANLTQATNNKLTIRVRRTKTESILIGSVLYKNNSIEERLKYYRTSFQGNIVAKRDNPHATVY